MFIADKFVPLQRLYFLSEMERGASALAKKINKAFFIKTQPEKLPLRTHKTPLRQAEGVFQIY
jgi:hypothetical protein